MRREGQQNKCPHLVDSRWIGLAAAAEKAMNEGPVLGCVKDGLYVRDWVSPVLNSIDYACRLRLPLPPQSTFRAPSEPKASGERLSLSYLLPALAI